MKEIKFRAWHKEQEEMVDVLNVDLLKKCIEYYHEFLNYNFIGFKDVELMQYTGLKDRNGKEIYEWDILSNDERYYIVIFENGSFRAESEDYSLDLVDVAHCSIVIGNVFENPELLED